MAIGCDDIDYNATIFSTVYQSYQNCAGSVQLKAFVSKEAKVNSSGHKATLCGHSQPKFRLIVRKPVFRVS